MGLFGSIGHFLFGGKTKKAETQTNAQATTTKDPWAPAIPALTNYINDTNNLYATQPMFSNYEQSGYDTLATDANTARGANQAAIDENNKTLSGAYLTPDSNPYLANIAKRISGIAGANTSATFGGKGRTGGGLAGYYGGKAVGDSLTDLYGANYANERSNMMTAVGNTPGLVQSSLMPGTALIGAGTEISNRPFQRNAMQGGLLTQIAGLGGNTNSTGSTNEKVYGTSSGLLGSIFNAATNKVFGTSRSTS
jgi:hypothetical protein